MNGHTITLIYRYCRFAGITSESDKKEIKRRWKALSHKQRGQESKFMKKGVEVKNEEIFSTKEIQS